MRIFNLEIDEIRKQKYGRGRVFTRRRSMEDNLQVTNAQHESRVKRADEGDPNAFALSLFGDFCSVESLVRSTLSPRTDPRT